MRLLLLTLLVFTSLKLSLADELPTDFKSSEVNEAIQSFDQSIKSVRSLTTAKVRTNRQELISKLKAQQEAVTKAGDLEEALKIKSLVGQLETVQAAAQESVVDEGEKAAGKVSVPRGAVKFGKSRYYVVTKPETYHVARVKCGLMGGHLVRIESEAEHQFVTKLIQSLGIQSQHHHYHWLYIDGSDEVESKVYRDSQGKEIEYLPWAEGYPQEPDKKFYLLINLEGKFYTTYSSRRFYICEWE